MKKQSYKLRGHDIYYDGEVFRYVDNDEFTVETWKSRPCGFCGLSNTLEGHDGCLGTLPGVMNACCGHGEVKQAYVQFEDGAVVYGQEALGIFKNNSCGPLTT